MVTLWFDKKTGFNSADFGSFSFVADTLFYRCFIMPGQLLFTLIGDSNVKRNMNPTNCSDRPLMTSAQVLICAKSELLLQSLRSVRRESNVCLLSCVTNFITSSEDISSTVTHRVQPVFEEFFAKIIEDCDSNPQRRYLVCPPMYRRSPLWYRDGIAQILALFSKQSRANLRPNLGVLPSFPTPAFESDGIHLNPYSGLEFVVHLFNSAQEQLRLLESDQAEVQVVAAESTRLLEDRMVALEQDHQRLSSTVDLHMAVKAEFDDFRANERTEDCFIVSGVPRISGRLTGKEWQDRAQRDVQSVIKTLIGHTLPIIVVHNATGPSPTSEVTYSVQMKEVADAKSIRSKFGSLFQRGQDARPEALSAISIQNLVTRETRIRISIMKILAKRYQDANPEGKAQVIGYVPRPILKLTPPPTAKDRRVRSFNFIEAIQKLPTNFTKEEVGALTRRAASRFPGQLRSLFVVLSDDQAGVGGRPPRSKRAASPSGASGSDGRRVRVAEDDE